MVKTLRMTPLSLPEDAGQPKSINEGHIADRYLYDSIPNDLCYWTLNSSSPSTQLTPSTQWPQRAQGGPSGYSSRILLKPCISHRRYISSRPRSRAQISRPKILACRCRQFTLRQRFHPTNNDSLQQCATRGFDSSYTWPYIGSACLQCLIRTPKIRS